MYQRPDIFSDNFYIKKNEWYNNQLKAFSQSRVYNMNFPSKLMNFHFYEAFKKCFSHSFNDKTFFALRKSKTFLWQFWLLKNWEWKEGWAQIDFRVNSLNFCYSMKKVFFGKHFPQKHAEGLSYFCHTADHGCNKIFAFPLFPPWKKFPWAPNLSLLSMKYPSKKSLILQYFSIGLRFTGRILSSASFSSQRVLYSTTKLANTNKTVWRTLELSGKIF